MELKNKDYLEIIDMDKEELAAYSKKELISLIHQLAGELYEMENK